MAITASTVQTYYEAGITALGTNSFSAARTAFVQANLAARALPDGGDDTLNIRWYRDKIAEMLQVIDDLEAKSQSRSGNRVARAVPRFGP